MPAQYAHSPIMADPQEQPALSSLAHFLLAQYQQKQLTPRLIGPHGEQIELPESVFHLLRDIVHDLAQGRAVMIVSRNQMLTTQQAADLLNVSRPYLVKLLEQGKLPFSYTGSHRRVRFEDLMLYKEQRDAERHKALDDLLQWSQETGLYDENE